MKILVTTFKRPLKWDCKPEETKIYNLFNETERRSYIKDLTNITSDEFKTIEEYYGEETKL